MSLMPQPPQQPQLPPTASLPQMPPPAQASPLPPVVTAAVPGETPPGWYTVPDGRVMWWDGNTWGQVAPQYAPQMPQQQIIVQTGQMMPNRMVTYSRNKTSHTFHLIMTVLTFGTWAVFVWGPMILWNSFGPRSRSVTKVG
jgi:hypothetical protein